MNDTRFKITPYQQMASAVTGAIITSLTMTPLDVVKTRLQAQQKSLLSNKCFLYCNGLMEHLCPCGPMMGPQSRKSLQFNGTIDAMIKITKYEGIRSLWSGLGPTLVLALPATVIYFVTYEQLRTRYTIMYYENYLKLAEYNTSIIPFYVPLFAGATSRILAVTVVNPLELIRTKMQSQNMKYVDVFQAIKSTTKNEGILSLWRGLSSTLYRDVPFSAIYWTSYEKIKFTFNVIDPTFGFSFLAGAISGSIAAFITTPFDVIKTHQQIEFGEKVIYTDKPENKKIDDKLFKRALQIYKSHGIKGLYAGIMPRLVKVAPACAIMISTFEYGKNFFYTYNLKKYNASFENQDKEPQSVPQNVGNNKEEPKT